MRQEIDGMLNDAVRLPIDEEEHEIDDSEAKNQRY
jgi:hypothetical protein